MGNKYCLEHIIDIEKTSKKELFFKKEYLCLIKYIEEPKNYTEDYRKKQYKLKFAVKKDLNKINGYKCESKNNVFSLVITCEDDVITYHTDADEFVMPNSIKINYENQPIWGFFTQIDSKKMIVYKEIDFTNVNTDNLIDATALFKGCDCLENIIWGKFNTKNIISMASMFHSCKMLTKLDLSFFDTSKVINMNGMFSNCNFKLLNISSFNTSKVIDMGYMFYYCKCNNIVEDKINCPFDTSNVTNMSYMFTGCNFLDIFSLSSFVTNKVEDMSCMFADCSNLKKLDLFSFNTSKVKNMRSMFDFCSNLEELYIMSFDFSNVNDISRCFANNYEYKKIFINNFNIKKDCNTRNICNCTHILQEEFYGKKLYGGNIVIFSNCVKDDEKMISKKLIKKKNTKKDYFEDQIYKAIEPINFVHKNISFGSFNENFGVVTFGKYPQKSESKKEKSDIEWIVLERDEKKHRALLLSKYILDYKKYNNIKCEKIIWKDCTIRTWLNNDFFNEAFTKIEQDKIININLKNKYKPSLHVSGKNDTFDRVFFLCLDDSKKYFGIKPSQPGMWDSKLFDSRNTKYSSYILKKISQRKQDFNKRSFWLRSQVLGLDWASCVIDDGWVSAYGSKITNYNGVRPAMWVKIN